MEKGERPIRFQPITSGLGFHPFSDGLPYAPVSKTVTPRPVPGGTGAVSAGAPSFAFPRVSVPVVAAAASPAKLIRDPAGEPFARPRFGLLYLFKRVLAYGIDTVLNITLLSAGLSLALWNQNVSPDLLMNPGILVISALFFLLFHWALVTAQEVAFGTSVGKRLFGLSLEGPVSSILLRAFLFVPSVGFCGVGLIWGLLDPEKRCWHDLAVNIQPGETARL